MSEPQRVRVGDPAPDFSVTDHSGATIHLRGLRGKSVVLFFYPKANSRGCTQQACAFRDAYERFLDAGAHVIGISSDAVGDQRAFATKNRLPFRVASDTDGAIRARYGVPRTLGILPGRVTYVIDSEGIVRHVFASQSQVERHVDEALDVVRKISSEERRSAS